jgi:predicted AAA+ superfamily ATPase
MNQFLPRIAEAALAQALGVSPVVVLTGSRQTGKSTLVRSASPIKDRPYWTLDDIQIRFQAESEPDDLIRRSPILTLDEVQRAPDLILAIKRAVDEQRPRRAGRFLLTGSANLLLMRRISETLAGRASYVTLWPLTRREQLGRASAGIWDRFLQADVQVWHDVAVQEAAPKSGWRHAVRRGGYPTPAYELQSDDQRMVWFSGYVQTYLERDLQDVASIDNLVDFQRLMRAAALRNGTLYNQAELGRDVGLPRPTVHRYLNVLETSYLIVRLEPYAVNRSKRLIRTPKTYWSDPGLALFLSGLDAPSGAYLENLVLMDLLAWRDSQFAKPAILYWRTASGQEVDFVIEHRGKLIGIEVKSGPNPGTSDIQHLRAFIDEYGRRVLGCLLLHTGDEVSWIGKGILAAPWWRVL